MTGKSAPVAGENRAKIYRRLLENYEEWTELMNALKKEERDLRRDFSRVADKAKMQKVMRRLHG